MFGFTAVYIFIFCSHACISGTLNADIVTTVDKNTYMYAVIDKCIQYLQKKILSIIISMTSKYINGAAQILANFSQYCGKIGFFWFDRNIIFSHLV